jgi:hypothetical protein
MALLSFLLAHMQKLLQSDKRLGKWPQKEFQLLGLMMEEKTNEKN